MFGYADFLNFESDWFRYKGEQDWHYIEIEPGDTINISCHIERIDGTELVAPSSRLSWVWTAPPI